MAIVGIPPDARLKPNMTAIFSLPNMDAQLTVCGAPCNPLHKPNNVMPSRTIGSKDLTRNMAMAPAHMIVTMLFSRVGVTTDARIPPETRPMLLATPKQIMTAPYGKLNPSLMT